MRKVIFVSFIVILLLGCSGRKTSSPSAGTTPAPGTNPPSAGAVIEFVWDTLVPDLFASENHKYGFDKNPKSKYQPELAKDIYVSVKKGETAKVSLQLSNSFDKHSLFNVTTQQMVTNCCTNKVTELELAEGHYEIYGDNVPLDRHIHVIGYNEKIVPAEYVQFDGEGGLCFDEGCYSFEGVKENFDRVYSQAVAKNAFVEKTASDFGLNKRLTFNLTAPIHGYELMEEFNDIVMRNINSEQNRIIFAINSIEWEWNVYVEQFDTLLLNNYLHAKLESTHNVLISSCGVATQAQKSLLTVLGLDRKNQVAKVLIPNASSYSPCVSIKMESELPVLPTGIKILSETAFSKTAQVAYNYLSADYKVIRSMIYAPRFMGEHSLNVILHELGHSLGLFDVFKDVTDGTYIYINGIEFATSEANIMTYTMPTGPKLRYRDLQAVITSTNNIIEDVYENQWNCINLSDCNPKR